MLTGAFWGNSGEHCPVHWREFPDSESDTLLCSRWLSADCPWYGMEAETVDQAAELCRRYGWKDVHISESIIREI